MIAMMAINTSSSMSVKAGFRFRCIVLLGDTSGSLPAARQQVVRTSWTGHIHLHTAVAGVRHVEVAGWVHRQALGVVDLARVRTLCGDLGPVPMGMPLLNAEGAARPPE